MSSPARIEHHPPQPAAWQRNSVRCRDGQRGFALLLVFAMAAAAAILLYMQLPRVAFEAQRDREDLLIQRGKDYRRAIELYVRKNNKYPDRLEDLERHQDMRFLRRRHKDPMTGKDDWRIIRINVAGQLENSLVRKQETLAGKSNPVELLGSGADVAENTALARQRSGDQLAANAEFPGGASGGGPGPANNADGSVAVTVPEPSPLDAGLVPTLDASGNIIELAAGQGKSPQPGPVQGLPNASTAPPAPNSGDLAPNQPRLGPGGIPIIENPAQAIARANAQAAATPGPNLPPQVGAPVRGADGGQTQSAAEIIGGLLTTPVPGGLAGIQQRRGLTSANTGTGQGFGAGIAGVASRYEMRGIKVFEEQDSIHKWEFVFDARQQATRNTQPAGGARNPTAPGAGRQPTFNQGDRTGRPGGSGIPSRTGSGGPPPPPGGRR